MRSSCFGWRSASTAAAAPAAAASGEAREDASMLIRNAACVASIELTASNIAACASARLRAASAGEVRSTRMRSIANSFHSSATSRGGTQTRGCAQPTTAKTTTRMTEDNRQAHAGDNSKGTMISPARVVIAQHSFRRVALADAMLKLEWESLSLLLDKLQ